MDNLIKVSRSDGTPVLAMELVESMLCSTQPGIDTFFRRFHKFYNEFEWNIYIQFEA